MLPQENPIDKYDFISYTPSDYIITEARRLMGRCYNIAHRHRESDGARRVGKEIALLSLDVALNYNPEPGVVSELNHLREYIEQTY